MSGQLRELKTRIKSVENTKKITRAMEMVAASKLRRFQTIMENSRPYTTALEEQMKRLYQAQKQSEAKSKHPGKSTLSHPFFDQREEKRVAVVIMTSDTGLCGSYNLDLVTMAKKFIAQRSSNAQTPLLIGLGKSGIISLKHAGYEFHKEIIDLRASRVEAVLEEFKTTLEGLYSNKIVDSIYVVYTHFLTLSKFQAITEKILPLEQPDQTEEETQNLDYIFEPSPEAIFEQLVPLFFESKTRMIFLEALVSEQIARMHAMHQATENAKEMIDSLVLLRNKARQASITKEIIEIVSGSQAAKQN